MGLVDRVRAWRDRPGQDAGEGMTRPAVLNADRASNDQVPRSAAAAEQLNRAAYDRRLSTVLTYGTPGPSVEKDRARLRVEMARDVQRPGGDARNAAREEARPDMARTLATADYATERATTAKKARARRDPGPAETARTGRVAAVARANRADEAAAKASAFVRGEIARSGGRAAQPGQGEGQRAGDDGVRAKRSRVSQDAG